MERDPRPGDERFRRWTTRRRLPAVAVALAGLLGAGVAPASAQLSREVEDTFARSGASGWLGVEPGGAYTYDAHPASTGFSVDSSGRISLVDDPDGEERWAMASLTALSLADQETSVDFSPESFSVGGDTMVAIVMRGTGDGYAAFARVTPTGAVHPGVGRLVGSTIDVLAESSRSVGTMTTSLWTLRARVVGHDPTRLAVKAWRGTEPSAWQVAVRDSTPDLQDAGGVSLRAAVEAGVSNATAAAPLVVSFDNLLVDAGADEIAPTAPTVSDSSTAWRKSAAASVSASGSTDRGGSAFPEWYESRVSADGGRTWSRPRPGNSRQVTAEGETRVQLRAVDRAGNVSPWAPSSGDSGTVRLDRTGPSAPVVDGGSLTWADIAQASIRGDGAVDALSGVAGYEWRIGVGNVSASGDLATVSAEGQSVVGFRAVDAAGNASAWTTSTAEAGNTVRIDRTAPTGPAVIGGSSTWRNAPSDRVEGVASSDPGGSGVAGYEFRTTTDGGASWSAPASGSRRLVTTEGQTLVQFRAVDRVGHVSGWTPAVATAASTVRLDRTPPATPVVVGGGGAWRSDPVVRVSAAGASDGAGSGLAGTELRTSSDRGATWSTPRAGASYAVSAVGETRVEFRSVDAVGLRSAWAAAAAGGEQGVVRLDRAAPSPPRVTGGSVSWHAGGGLTVAAAGSVDAGPSGLAGYEVRTTRNGGSSWGKAIRATSIRVSGEGETLVQFRSVDRAANASAWMPRLGDPAGMARLDRIAPPPPRVTSPTHPDALQGYGGDFSASWPAVGDPSGIAGYAVRFDAPLPPTAPTQAAATVSRSDVGEGLHYLLVRSIDGAGNVSAAARNSFVRGPARAASLRLVSPAPGAWSNRLVALQAQAPAGVTGIRFEFRRSADDTLPWNEVPLARLDAGDGSPVVLPVQPAVLGYTDPVRWDLPATVASDPGVAAGNAIGAASASIAIRAVGLGAGAAPVASEWVAVHLDQRAPEPTSVTIPAASFGGDIPGADATLEVAWAPAVDDDVAGYAVDLVGDRDPGHLPALRIDAPAMATTLSVPLPPAAGSARFAAVRVVDQAGNASPPAYRAFRSRDVTLVLPGADEVVRGAAAVPLAASAATSVCFQYRTAPERAWQAIPAAEVARGGTPIESWPVEPTGSDDAPFAWDGLAATEGVDHVSGRAVEVRAVAWSAGAACDGAVSNVATVHYEASDATWGGGLPPAAGVPANGQIGYSIAADLCIGGCAGRTTDTANPDGSGARRVDDQATRVRFSHDGRTTAWLDDSNVPCIEDDEVSLTGSRRFSFVATDIDDFELSPDGSSIVIASTRICGPPTGYQVRVLATDGTLGRTISEHGAVVGEATPFGSQVAFADETHVTWIDTLGTLRFSRTDLLPAQDLALGEGIVRAFWSHDGTTLAMQGQGGVVTFLHSAGGPVAIAAGLGVASTPPLDRIGPFAPDGVHMLVAGDDLRLAIVDVRDGSRAPLRDRFGARRLVATPDDWAGLPADPDELARYYRPQLYFDRHEPWLPVDPVAVVAERDPAPPAGVAGNGYHALCWTYRKQIGGWPGVEGWAPAVDDYDYRVSCDDRRHTTIASVAGAADLEDGPPAPEGFGSPAVQFRLHGTGLSVSSADAPVDDDWANGTDVHAPSVTGPCDAANPCDGDGANSVMYYERADVGGTTYFQYWWFQRFHAAPEGPHQGDWQGAVVAVRNGPNPAIMWVAYSQNAGWYRYEAADLEAMGALRGTHPQVYVARGTHAGYPSPCAGGCPLADGPAGVDETNDGGRSWAANDGAVCARVRCVRRFSAAPINAFRSNLGDLRWGVGGPLSPASQRRWILRSQAFPPADGVAG